MFKNYASENTPVTKRYWKTLTNDQRVDAINEILKNNSYFENISNSRAHENGQVFIILSENISAAQRGSLLLDFEEHIKKTLDEGLNVWCEPLGDKNSLRNLRGIQIKT